jgi:hypothetical protein
MQQVHGWNKNTNLDEENCLLIGALPQRSDHRKLCRVAEALEAKSKLQVKHVEHCKKFAPEAVRRRLAEVQKREDSNNGL